MPDVADELPSAATTPTVPAGAVATSPAAATGNPPAGPGLKVQRATPRTGAPVAPVEDDDEHQDDDDTVRRFKEAGRRGGESTKRRRTSSAYARAVRRGA